MSEITSRNVRGYVKAVLRRRKAEARLQRAEGPYLKARRAMDEAVADVLKRRGNLSGTQMAAAERLLANPAVETLAKPCTPKPELITVTKSTIIKQVAAEKGWPVTEIKLNEG